MAEYAESRRVERAAPPSAQRRSTQAAWATPSSAARVLGVHAFADDPAVAAVLRWTAPPGAPAATEVGTTSTAGAPSRDLDQPPHPAPDERLVGAVNDDRVDRPERSAEAGAAASQQSDTATLGAGDFAAVPVRGFVHGGSAVRRDARVPADPLGGSNVRPDVLAALQRRAGTGSVLPVALGSQMGEQLGRDLSNVRVHTDSEADGIARSMQALAFTHGTDIYFQQGTYAPTDQRGQHLLAHELSHVAQEPIPAVGGSVRIGRADDPAEGAADRSAGRVLSALRGQAPSRPDALTSPAEPDSTQVVRATATDPVPADGPGTVIRRTVKIIFNEQGHEMEDPVDPSLAKINFVDATRTPSMVATENAGPAGLQWAHTTSHTVLTNMWVRALDDKTWLQAWTIVRERYYFLRDLLAAWYSDNDLATGASALIKNNLPVLIQTEIDKCSAELTRGGHDLTAGVWAAKPLGGLPTEWKYYDHLPTLAADGVDTTTHVIKPWKPLLNSEQVAKLQSACEQWMVLRGQIPWTSVKADSYVTGDRTGPDKVETEVGNQAGKLALTADEARPIAQGIIKTFDFFPATLTATRTLTHAAGVAARHLVEHFQYHPDLLPAWRPAVKTEFLKLWKRKVTAERDTEDAQTEAHDQAKAAAQKNKGKGKATKLPKIEPGRSTQALDELLDNWADVTQAFDDLYAVLAPAIR